MSQSEIYLPESFIKNIAIEIRDDYTLTNAPFSAERDPSKKKDSKDDANHHFIGRRSHKDKFLKFLQDSNTGIFLVTGERGIGKTSFVNHVLKNYIFGRNVKEADEEIRTIHLTLSQNKPREIDILWLMVSHVYDKFQTFLDGRWYNRLQISRNTKDFAKLLFTAAALALIFPLFLIWKGGYTLDSPFVFGANPTIYKFTLNKFTLISFAAFVVMLILFLIFKIREGNSAKKNNPRNKIRILRDRCNALLTEEMGGGEEINFEGISGSLFGRNEKTTKQYAIASTKEIEYELEQFLEQVGKKYRLKFIFVFDELDKVDPVATSAYFYEDLDKFQKTENANPRDFRDRKQAIINLIAGLKNFFTTAKARFIFIAGNEMFDAALADIADRQASISSIFTYTFHIESFLKERNIGEGKNNDSLSAATEEYLKWVLFGTEKQEAPEPGKQAEPELSEQNILALIKSGCTNTNKLEIAKAIITVQNFITYLTYRANGSPKKIIKIIHEFITVKSADNAWVTKNDGKTIFIRPREKNIPKKERDNSVRKILFLYFNYSNQYRIGFLNYLYRPFLIQYGRNFKLFSDNIIISTPYLFDHLLKFHPFAFSLSNLELIPEVVSSNKTPSLQEHLRNIIEYLGENHIRRTDLGLFDYKFYSRTLNEITYISKLFEEESAAFNFTLDESYLVKIFVRSKIKELRSIYSRFLGDPKEAGTRQIFSIAHLNGKLGDLHFFDQEYDDAIVSYSDAIRPINNQEITTMSIREFITLFRNKLKLGLCFERTSSYDEALAFYADCCQDAKRFMMFRLWESQKIKDSDNFENSMVYETSSLNDLLQVIIQGFLATIIVEEKLGMEGITPKKLNISLGNFLSLAYPVIKKTGGNEYDSLVFANAFLLMGKLFYFKNTSLKIDEIVLNNFPVHLKKRIKQLAEISGILNAAENDLIKSKPTNALFMYLIGIFEIIESKNIDSLFFNNTKENENKIIKALLEVLAEFLERNDQNFLSYHYKYIANYLSSIGDSLLSMCKIDKAPAKNYRKIKIGDLFNFDGIRFTAEDYELKPDKYNFGAVIKAEKDSEVGIILKCYHLAGKYFVRYGRTAGCSYEYRKIFYLLKTIIAHDNEVLNKKFIHFIDITLVQPALEISSQNSGHTDRHMVKKIEKIHDSKFYDPLSFALNNISNNPETREIIIVYNYIKVKLGLTEKAKNIISPYNSLGTQYLRLVELEFYAKYIFVTHFEKYFQHDNKMTFEIRLDGENILYAIDYLYSMLSMLRIQKIYGNDFLIGHSSFAYTHLRIAKFLKKFKVNKEIRDGIESIIGKGSYVSFDKVYHFQMAKDLYIKVIQLHTTGKEYKKTIGEMIYLEDDFSDNAYHFGAAINRYLMINGDFVENIKECENEIRIDPYYNSENYTDT